MAGIKALIGLAMTGSIGLLFLVLGCALPEYKVWWPMFVLFFYFLAPLPLLIAQRFQDEMASSSALTEFALFATTGVVVSAFALPLVLAHAPMNSPVIHWGAAALTEVGNLICFATIAAYFYVFREEDGSWGYSMW